ncbi:MAG: hypothetical protein KDA20_01010 [Phycisphaerales bacterium]|nr:hypothetical protein [Phycisphaerales bacterium]
MSSELRKQEILCELLCELERTKRRRAVGKGIGTGVAVVLTIGAGLLVAWMSLPRASGPTSPPIAISPPTTPTMPTAVDYVRTDPAILDRVRVTADGSRIERVRTRDMSALRVNDEQLVAFMANTDEPIGVVRVGGEARVVSARWEQTSAGDDVNRSPL